MWGMIVMGLAIAILFVVPWLDRSPVKSMRYKGWYSRISLLLFGVTAVATIATAVPPGEDWE